MKRTIARRGSLGPTFTTALLTLAVVALTLVLAPRAEAYLYWADGDIKRANLDGNGIQSLVSDGRAHNGVAVDDKHIYWGASVDPDTNAIARADLDGTGADYSFITFTAPFPPLPAQVAVDDEHVYWATLDPDTIGRANLDGSDVDHSFITGASHPLGVAVDDEHVYWSNDPGSDAIGRATLDGSDVDHSFITSHPGASWLAVDSAHLYWATHDGVGRANLDGSGVDPSFFISGAGGPSGLAVDATHIYWTAPDFGSLFGGTTTSGLWRAKIDGSGVECLITGFSPIPGDVAVDALGPPPSDPPGCDPPANEFSFGKLKRNKKRGTAKLPVEVPGPGELELARNKKLKGAEKRADAAGKEKLPIKPRRKARKKLNRRGKAKVKAKVTYTPDGGEARTRSKRIKLRKRLLE